MSSKKRVSIFGVTGSVGASAAEVILASPQLFDVQTVTAGTNGQKLADLAIRLRAKKAVIAQEDQLQPLKARLSGFGIAAEAGKQALIKAAAEPADLLLAATVGFEGLRPILAALENGTNVAIANKEPLVAAGPLLIAAAKKSGARILPVDSEHNAIFQVWEDHNRSRVEKIILTASGGPFLNWSQSQMQKATPEQAIAHPNWSMGPKISVDSATMINKALEIIEAAYLFDLPPEKIEVVIHPQSIIHSLVVYTDGSILAQMGESDMRIPIAHTLGWPERLPAGGKKLDVSKLSGLTFQTPNFAKFPALGYAYKCLRQGPTACITLNASNEIAVKAFLDRRIGFPAIIECVAAALLEAEGNLSALPPKTVEECEKLDQTVRVLTENIIARRTQDQQNKTVRSQ
ncbi:MAG: 1-deoxy-D-xylulose-5-phosphate reductoisomerase [Alphaproteobacteria bacterium]|nr:1-deoxy-D-xylulose-5-phosphate reductoisomerase [Alphaproteobacteria bacterium]QQS56297.1 MAG: 1-deoxy-D-xylulose-5-phosphate reductoisomerase [Alphaproteobacteria bacterium]